MVSFLRVPIDWPYASMSTATRSGSPAQRPRPAPVDCSVFEELVRAVRDAYTQGRLDPWLRPDAADVDALIASAWGDARGAALAVLARVSADRTLTRRLAEGAHLEPSTDVFANLPQASLARILAVQQASHTRVQGLGSRFDSVVSRLVQWRVLEGARGAELTRQRDKLVESIRTESASWAEQLRPQSGVTSAGPALRGGASTDFEGMTRNLRSGLRYAADLKAKGLEAPAAHVAATLRRLAPTAVRDTSDYERLAGEVRVHAGNAEGPLLEAIRLRRGMSNAAPELETCVRKGELAPEPCSCKKEWTFRLGLETHNDNAASLRDLRERSDDGPTTSTGIEGTWSRDNEQWVVSLDQAMFTERGGSLRTDLVQLTVRHLKTEETGRLFFDTVTSGWLFGAQGTGDFGGAKIQDGWHSIAGGRRLDGSLQDTYPTAQQLALLLGAEVSGTKTLGLFDVKAGAQASVPIGSTGYGRVQAGTGVRFGGRNGPCASAGFDAGLQWTTGRAFRFDGAPRSGFFLTPRVGIGWERDNWDIGLEWQGNRFHTQPGLGNRDGESIGLSISFRLF